MASAGALSFGPRMWSAYCGALQRRPIFTKAVTSLVGFTLGDTIAQLGSRTGVNDKHDWLRTARFATFGFLVQAPLSHYFYGYLDKAIMPHAASSAGAVLSKVAIDQLMWTPIQLGLFYAAITTMEGRPEQLSKIYKDKYWSTLTAGWMMWPLAHVINFRFVPNAQRILYINVVNLGWNVILCKIASKDNTSLPSTTKATPQRTPHMAARKMRAARSELEKSMA